jgi:hypothetical protein
MSKTEEIVKEYDKKRAALRVLSYAAQISMILMFYTIFRFGNDRPSIVTFCFVCAFLTQVLYQGYVFSLYGIGTTRRGKDLPAFRWKIAVVGVLTGLILVEVVSFLTNSSDVY